MTSYIIKSKVFNICTVLTHCSQGGCIVLPLLLWIAINAFLVFLGSALVTFVEVSFLHYLVCLPLFSDKIKLEVSIQRQQKAYCIRNRTASYQMKTIH